MMDENYNLQVNGQVLTELLIQNLAQQRASIKVLISLIAKTDQDELKALSELNKLLKEETASVIRDLFARHGKLDLDNLI